MNKCTKCGKIKPDITPTCGMQWEGMRVLDACVCDATVFQR